MPTESDYQELAELNARFSQTPAGKARRRYLDAKAEMSRLEACLESTRRIASDAQKEFGELLVANKEDEALFLQIREKADKITFPQIVVVDDAEPISIKALGPNGTLKPGYSYPVRIPHAGKAPGLKFVLERGTARLRHAIGLPPVQTSPSEN